MNDASLVVAVMTGPTNMRSPYLRSLARVGRERGILVYSFTPTAVRLPNQEWVSGIPHAVGLKPVLLPFPDVVYNRLPTRKEESGRESLVAKDIFQRRGIPYFNARFLNKGELDQTLRKHADTRRFLPDTRIRADSATIAQMLQNYGAVYVKPVAGSFGEGILRIAREGLQYRLESKEYGQTRYFDRMGDCLQDCQMRMNGSRYLVQEEVPLAAYEGCRTDFRVHAIRSVQGWRVAAIGAKVSRSGAITTHVKSGGRLASADRVLEDWFGSDGSVVREQMVNAAIAICERLTQSFDGYLGELGLDMGIARDNRMVLFEANSKPGRIIFTHPSLRAADRRSREVLLEWAESLVQGPKSVE